MRNRVSLIQLKNQEKVKALPNDVNVANVEYFFLIEIHSTQD